MCALLLCLLAAACGTKKNTPSSRNWQAFTTRYNVYFNGSEHYKETLKAMESDYSDDYSRIIPAHPAEARADDKLPQPAGSFKRTIQKMQKAIQLHSIKKKPAKRTSSTKDKEFRAREEFNPFLHNAWLMMGRAQYMDGDFMGAAATFMYITRHFGWLPETVTEARLWQALSYCAMDWDYEAENTLHAVKEKDLTNGTLRHLYNLANGDLMVRMDRYADAVPYLLEAARTARGPQKHRLWFLLGQVYSNLGRNAEAYGAFGKAASGASTSYRTKFNARIKQSEVYTGHDIRREVKALKGMTRYARNAEYLDQIYYAIGNLYLSRGDTALAKKNYIEAVGKSTRNGIDKALVQIALGGIYFDEGDYAKAQPCYQEAVPQLADNYPGRRQLQLRSDVLDELAVYSENVHLQDSLLRLARLTPDERREACRKIVDDLIRREKEAAEEARRAEALAQAQAAGQTQVPGSKQPAVQQFAMNTDKSWYFYNTMTKNNGKQEFQRRWGARRLEDDWRRRNKATFSLDDGDEEEGDENTGTPPEGEGLRTDTVPGATDPHNIEYYLRQIPATEAEVANCNDIIQEGLYNMGVILKDKLEDYAAARKSFDRLDAEYPDNVYRLDVYYNMYLMAVREDNKALAEEWRQKILDSFPDSPYGIAMRDPDYFDNLRRMHAVQEQLYERAYADYLADDTGAVHAMTKRVEEEFPLSPLLPKFVFIDALSYLAQKDYGPFRERLTELLQKWPDTDMTEMASGILKGLREGREPNSGTGTPRGMLWDIRLADGTDGEGDAAERAEAQFTDQPDSPHYVVLAFPLDSVSPNALLYEVARFNFSSFTVKDFDLEPMSFSNIGLLVVKGFGTLGDAERYRSVMERSGLELPVAVRPVIISKSNFELLLREGRSFEEYFRYREAEDIRRVQAQIEEEESEEEETGEEETGDEEETGEGVETNQIQQGDGEDTVGGR